MQVYKFGGASVRDADAIRNVGKIVGMTSHRPLAIVISAMGKTTNALEEIIHAHYHHRDQLLPLIDNLKKYHADIASLLLPGKDNELQNDLHDLCADWVASQLTTASL